VWQDDGADQGGDGSAEGDRADLYRGFGEGLSRAFELALTPAIIGGIGYGLDRWLGVVPVLTIVFFLAGIGGLFARMWYGYEDRMRAIDASAPWARR